MARSNFAHGIKASLVIALAMTACQEDNDESSASTSTSTTTQTSTNTTPAALSYWQDVAPIYFNRCVSCHQAGGIAPIALDNYQDAKNFAQAAKASVVARTMPPWLMTSDGSCGEYIDEGALRPEEIEIIANWVDQGAPEGTPTDLEHPSRPDLPEAQSFHTPLFTPMPAGTELSEFDEYRCFAIPLGRTDTSFLTGFEVLPGEKRLVHHVVGYLVDANEVGENGKSALEIMNALDAESPDRLGWPCYADAGEGVPVGGAPVVWAPGTSVVQFPAQSGIPLAPSHMLVAQVHYNFPNGENQGLSDQTEIRLQFKSNVMRQAFSVLVDGLLDTLGSSTPHVIPPGVSDHPFSWGLKWEETGLEGLPYVDIWGVFPHMHELGQTFEATLSGVDANNQATSTCAADIERWDFEWQLQYFRTEPMRFGPGGALNVTCHFDSTGRTEPTLPGWGTSNEMCLIGLYAVLPEGRSLR
jgi:hypothetical protein